MLGSAHQDTPVDVHVAQRRSPRFALSGQRVFAFGVAIVTALLVILPVAILILGSFSAGGLGTIGPLTLENYRLIFTDGTYYEIIFRTTWIALASLAIAAALGLPLAWLLTRTNVIGLRAWRLLAYFPLFTAPLLVVIAWNAGLNPRTGHLDRLTFGLVLAGPDMVGPSGIVVFLGLYFSTYVFLFAGPAFASVDARPEQAARVSGAGLARMLRHVTFPAVRPAVFSVAILVLVLAMGLFEIPVVFGLPIGYDVLSIKIYRLMSTYPAQFGPGVAVASITLLMTTLLLILYYRTNKRVGSVHSIAARGSTTPSVRLRRLQVPAVAFLVVYFMITVVIPLAFILMMTTTDVNGEWTGLRHYESFFNGPQLWQLTRNTLIVGILAALGLTLISAAVAYVIRFRLLGRFGTALDFAVTFPLAIPGIVLGAGMLYTYLVVPGFRLLYATIAILIVATLTQFLAVSVRSTVAAASQVPDTIFHAARASGAGWFTCLIQIFLPAIRGHLFESWRLTQVLCLRELTAILLLWSSASQTLPIEMFFNWRDGNIGQLAVLGLVQTALCVLVLAGGTLVVAAAARLAKLRTTSKPLRFNDRDEPETTSLERIP